MKEQFAFLRGSQYFISAFDRLSVSTGQVDPMFPPWADDRQSHLEKEQKDEEPGLVAFTKLDVRGSLV
jgi:hypothetical protein